MHGYGMLGDLVHLALYLMTIAVWALLWLVCIFNANGYLRRLLGSHALVMCVLLFPLLPATFIGGALIAFGIEGLFWILCISGVGVPLAGLRVVRHYIAAIPHERS